MTASINPLIINEVVECMSEHRSPSIHELFHVTWPEGCV